MQRCTPDALTMFYWVKSGGSDTVHGLGDSVHGLGDSVHGLGDISKAEILRGIVTEKLTTAAQEILAVVERTVAGYEEEAAGFRREIDRQRRQLERLLQPRVKLERRGVEDTGSLGLLWYDDDGDDEGGDEEQPSDLKDPDYQITSRGRSDRRRPGRPGISDAQNHVDLRICVLEDHHTNVLSNRVFQKSPVQDLRCPRGLTEEDFLDLLRSTFPKLVAEEPLGFFTTDRTKRLQPLRAKTLTPEEIDRCIRLTGAGSSALYIRLKTAEDPQSGDEDLRPLQGPATTSADRSQTYARRRRGRPRLGEEPSHHFLRVCMLEDSRSDVLPKNVLLKSSIQDLRCPRGLQEADFLDLLRSTFPQLAGDNKPFNIFKSDRSRKLQRLKVKTLTPEEIYRSMKSTGVAKTLLYIRLKQNDEAAVVVKSDEVQLSSSGLVQSEEEADEEDGDWKPDPELRSSKMRGGEEPRRPALIKHAWSHVAEAQSVCGVCGERFGSVEELKAHLRNYQKTHDCSYCGKSFLTVAGLSCHTTLHTGDRPFKCDVCNKSFAHMSGLSAHRWVHVADKPHKCDSCPKAFGLKAQLRAHRKVHTGRDKYLQRLRQVFYDLRSLTRHKATHSGERRYGCEAPYGCSECGRFFKRKTHLTNHTRSHLGIKLFVCGVCGKACSRQEHLTVHMRTHNGERPYQCSVCDKAFTQGHCLKTHMRSHQGDDEPVLNAPTS
ncbi:Zinc finger protein 84 [Collichthys lucidus]|uniref:Zinc finger protein 84 n=1 Tax=Collichthys lucidus TaxID=240159 RepID=A0A4U5VY32_COLLU|nr:Zinc finger protein 84 [Collichthys lucidus]